MFGNERARERAYGEDSFSSSQIHSDDDLLLESVPTNASSFSDYLVSASASSVCVLTSKEDS
jgi:hypothetical protein